MVCDNVDVSSLPHDLEVAEDVAFGGSLFWVPESYLDHRPIPKAWRHILDQKQLRTEVLVPAHADASGVMAVQAVAPDEEKDAGPKVPRRSKRQRAKDASLQGPHSTALIEHVLAQLARLPDAQEHAGHGLNAILHCPAGWVQLIHDIYERLSNGSGYVEGEDVCHNEPVIVVLFIII